MRLILVGAATALGMLSGCGDFSEHSTVIMSEASPPGIKEGQPVAVVLESNGGSETLVGTLVDVNRSWIVIDPTGQPERFWIPRDRVLRLTAAKPAATGQAGG